MAVNSLLAKITSPKEPANWTHLTAPLTSYRWEMGPKLEMAGEMAGGHFSGRAQNGRPNGRTGRNWPNMRYPAKIALPLFGHFAALPKTWPPAISQPFPVWARFPPVAGQRGPNPKTSKTLVGLSGAQYSSLLAVSLHPLQKIKKSENQIVEPQK